ncbi:peptide transporter, partial [Thioclava sp. BHET1]
MFKSFFPRPKLFFLSAVIWTAIAVILWYTVGEGLGPVFGFHVGENGGRPIVGLGYFVTPDFLWFYLYSFIFFAIFYAAWALFAPHPYQRWSIAGSALIIFVDYYGVQV